MSASVMTPSNLTPGLPATLDALSFPLYGSRLIEASAGTGKTYTIATLYVRLVLGHGGAAAHGRALTPPEILVVTFTDAATQELRDRIRVRLIQAAAGFEADPAQPLADALLQDLRASYAQTEWATCARQLRLAAEWMDEAAVATIHSWCYRMLREHAFDSGNLFQQTLITDQQDLLAQAVRDYWRRHFYPLSPDQADQAQRCFADPESLRAALRPLLARSDARYTVGDQELLPPASVQEPLELAVQWQQRQQALELHARQIWASKRTELHALLQTLRPDFNLKTFSQAQADETFVAWLQALDHWAESGEQSHGLKLEQLGQSKIKLKGKKETPHHSFFAALDALAEVEAQRPQIKPQLLMHALLEVRQDLEQTKQQRAELGFDDLLARLGQALDSSRGDALAAAIRQRFPVALMDEFQDTDPLQYRIFERIYAAQGTGNEAGHAAGLGGDAEAAPACGWFMIGDPKQAIYSFRGADIHTYLQARAATEGRHYTLGTNYRSSLSMVAAVNHVFEQAELREQTPGAFRFRTPEGHNPLPFMAVQAQGREEQLLIDQQLASACTLWLLQGRADQDKGVVKMGAYRAEMAERCASAVRLWLEQGRAGRTGFKRANKPLQALQPSDLAILVRGRSEADAVRKALARRQIASVYLSDRDSVFASPEAGDMLAWLQACAQPTDDGLLRSALASPAMGWSWAELDRLNHDELHWEALVQRLQGYRRMWRHQGVLPMVRHWLADFELPACLLAQAQGERRLTNLLHLAEWLQRQALELDGEHALIRALVEQIERPREEEILRLESDAGLVQVITIHKSKGLEYPLVLLPFVAGWKEVKKSSEMTAYHVQAEHIHVEEEETSSRGGYTVELGQGNEQAQRLADEERLSEDMRLLYVALTRARHAVWLGVAPLAAGNAKSCQLHKGAFGYLLNGNAEIAADQLPVLLQSWVNRCPSLALEPAPAVDKAVLPTPLASELGPARQVRRPPAEAWWIASYSALRIGGQNTDAQQEHEPSDAGRAEAGNAQEAAWQDEMLQQQRQRADELASSEREILGIEVDAQVGELAAAWHALPQGAEMGSLIHALLEQAAQQGFAEVASAPQAWQAQIARLCEARGWAQHTTVLQDGLLQLLTRALPLPGQSPLVLADLRNYSSEMEFWLAAQRVDTGRIDQLVGRYTLDGQPRPRLLPDRLNGMLKGFMDLVFEHQGRYYIADYKSNWLGPDVGAYDQTGLRLSMLSQRYDLQYTLYLLALHRLLSSRRPDYDYERDVGGVVYLYLRGVVAAGGAERAQSGVFFERPPRVLIEALDALFAGAERASTESA